MLKVNVTAGNKETNKWDTISLIPFKSFNALYPDQKSYGTEQYGLDKETIELPDDEIIELDAAYTPLNRGLNIVAFCGGVEILNLSCFKQDDKGWDPSIVIRTPDGNYISLMFGTEA